MTSRNEDESGKTVQRFVQLWPVLVTAGSLIAISAANYSDTRSTAETVKELKSIAISQSSKLNDLKTEQSVQRIQISTISTRIEKAEGNINSIQQDIWKLQQQYTNKR